MHVSIRRRHLTPLLLAALFATLLTAAPGAAEVIANRPAPAVWDVHPATGELVADGPVQIAGTGLSSSGVASARFLLDGVELATTIVSRNSVAARAAATVDVAPGEHVVEARFTAGDGSSFVRHWRFTATDRPWIRVAGADRVATAAAIARSQGGDRPAAVLARSHEFADALAGAPLALAVDAPLLLTASDELDARTQDALIDLVVPGGTVHLLGGETALSSAIADELRGLGFRVQRHRGEDRFGTAAAIADALPAFDTVVIANGRTFPDALAGAGPAAAHGWPILLTEADVLPAATRELLSGVDTAYVLGGTAAVSTAVMDEVDAVVATAVRLSGADRWETAAAVVRLLGPSTAGEFAVASGLDFPDALGGAVDAARRGVPLLLGRSTGLPAPIRSIVAERAPLGVRLYGGDVALADHVGAEVLAPGLDTGATLLSASPAVGDAVISLDHVTLQFDAEIVRENSNFSVWFGDREIHTHVGFGDFEDTLVLDLGPLPYTPAFGEATPVRVVGNAHDGSGWRHVDQTFFFRKSAMSRGDHGPEVREVQERLLDLGYWLDKADGNFGSMTTQAVMAFQKAEGLPITGAADPATRARLDAAERPVPRSTSGRVIEIDKTRQLLLFTQDGRVTWAFNTSTGTEKPYTHEGRTHMADTPVGRWQVYREIDGERESELGILWRPKYFHTDGIAIHGSASVPGHPASHGCVRVTYTAMDFIWSAGLAPIGTSVWVYGTSPGT